MGLNQVAVSLWLLLAVGLSAAQWPQLRNLQLPAGFQSNDLRQGLRQVSTGVGSQQGQSDSQTGSSVVAPVGFVLQGSTASRAQQVIQRPEKKITWRFPEKVQLRTSTSVPFVRPSKPATVQGVTVQCTGSTVYVGVRKALFGSEATLNIAGLSLGGCAGKGTAASSQVLVFESALHGCNSKRTVTASELVYTFSLGFASVPSGGSPIRRQDGVNVSIECHYPRHHNVSSSALVPAWLPHSSAQAAEELLVFSLRLMMEDWMSERGSNQYYLGEVMFIEASVLQFKHVPLRVLVDSCVATTGPDPSVSPRYSFIENHGCLIDGKLAPSGSCFMPQTQADKLRFEVKAFKFQQMSSLVYIACVLKATMASAAADPEHKACSFSENGWTAAFGGDQVCRCCSDSCTLRRSSDVSSDPVLYPERIVSLGPIVIKDNV